MTKVEGVDKFEENAERRQSFLYSLFPQRNHTTVLIYILKKISWINIPENKVPSLKDMQAENHDQVSDPPSESADSRVSSVTIGRHSSYKTINAMWDIPIYPKLNSVLKKRYKEQGWFISLVLAEDSSVSANAVEVSKHVFSALAKFTNLS